MGEIRKQRVLVRNLIQKEYPVYRKEDENGRFDSVGVSSRLFSK